MFSIYLLNFPNIELNNPNDCAIANWTKLEYDAAMQKGKFDHAKKFLSLHNKDIEKAELEDINKEITNFYLRSYDIQRAELYIKTVVKSSNDQSTNSTDDVSENRESAIESFIDKFELYVEKPILDAFRTVTSTLRGFREQVKDLKEKV